MAHGAVATAFPLPLKEHHHSGDLRVRHSVVLRDLAVIPDRAEPHCDRLLITGKVQHRFNLLVVYAIGTGCSSQIWPAVRALSKWT